MRCHSVPIQPIGALDDLMGRIRLLVEGAVIPQCVAAVRIAGLQSAVIHSAQDCICRRTGESFGNLGGFRDVSGKGGRRIESAHTVAGGHLIPLASVCGLHHLVGRFRPLILGGAEQIHIGLFPIRAGGYGADMSAGDLCVGVAHTACGPGRRRGHIVRQAAVGNISCNGAGDLGRTTGDGGDGLGGERGAVACGHAAKDAAHKPYTAASAHPRAAVHYGVPDKAVGLISTDKSGEHAACSSATTSRSASWGAAPAAKYGGRASTAASGKTGNGPGCHQHFYAHAAACLSHGKAQGGKVAVTFLRNFQ